MEANPILVERWRSGQVESVTRGAICVVSSEGNCVFFMGNINQTIFTRSALKPFQSLPLLALGAADHYGFTGPETAITFGSHNADQAHQAAVLSILKKLGLGADALQCGPQLPGDRATRKLLETNKEKPSALHNNCSGKHAGFLALAAFLQAPLHHYLAHDHEVQRRVKTFCAAVLELPESDLLIGEDGCSAPNYACSLYHLALGYKNLATGLPYSPSMHQAMNRLVECWRKHPHYVAGTGRYCTEVCEGSNGEVLGKTGADGVYCMAIPRLGLGIAIKVDDGAMGPQYLVAQALVDELGLAPLAVLEQYRVRPILNWNKHQTGVEQVSDSARRAIRQLPNKLGPVTSASPVTA
ncbi:MAG: asparaginase [Bacteroidetes bacterium]|nr:asparaginase [Bacteroidota bacterium]